MVWFNTTVIGLGMMPSEAASLLRNEITDTGMERIWKWSRMTNFPVLRANTRTDPVQFPVGRSTTGNCCSAGSHGVVSTGHGALHEVAERAQEKLARACSPLPEAAGLIVQPGNTVECEQR
jgi:hypothetical protein